MPASRIRTRIVATIGPASSSEAKLRQLVKAGVNVFRLNFSHGTHAEHRGVARRIRKVARSLDEPVAILQDLSGPKLRVGELAEGVMGLRVGNAVRLEEAKRGRTISTIPLPIPGLVKRLRRGHILRLADGTIELRVVGTGKEGITAHVVHGGLLRSRQGVHVPGVDLGLQAFTAKDRKDLEFGLELGVDAVALSFVRDASDIRRVWRFVEKRGAHPFLVAKIERAAAMDHLEDIIAASSGVMVARGDLGVELGMAKVPLAQKHIVATSRRLHRPVITATQMLESMIERPTPTRAEVSDVANAVLEGTDALMLSGETAVGKHPLSAVRTLVRVAKEVEPVGTPRLERAVVLTDDGVAVARAARSAARTLNAQAIVALTNSGRTARLIAAMRPGGPVIGVTSYESTWRRMSMLWGVTPVKVPRARSMRALIESTRTTLLGKRMVKKGGRIVMVYGDDVFGDGANTVKVVTIRQDSGRRK